MKTQYAISIYLDTRRELIRNKKRQNEKKEKKEKIFPVKLRVWSTQLRKQKLYPTTFEFTKEEFKSIWKTEKPRNEHKEIRLELQAEENKANEAAKSTKPFSFEQFEKRLFIKPGEGDNVFYQYQLIIDENKKLGHYGNASNYELSLKSIKDFVKYSIGKEPNRLLFFEITPFWLKSYENYMLNIKSRSRTTVSMYLRALRAVFNVLRIKEFTPEIYPFGNNKYQVPSVENVKKALTGDQLKQLFEARPGTPEQEKAKDFWFFSYACNGMNVKDIALLRFKNIQGDKIEYFRAKTINTGKKKLKPITVYLNDFSLSVIEKYGNPDKSPDNLIFSIIQDNQTEVEKFAKIKNFTRFINQNLKKLATAEKLPGNISSYWARHSMATNAIRKGASMEFISEALGHSDLKTTQNYIDSFEDKTKKEFAKGIMNF